MFHRDSPAPPLGHTTATITDRENQNTMQGNQTSDVVKGHRTPRPHRCHEPPGDRSTISTRMTKELSLPQITSTATTLHSNNPTSTPTQTSNYQQRIRGSQNNAPKGERRHQDAIVVRSRDGSEAFARGTRMSGQGSFPMTPSRREVAPEGVVVIVADKIDTRLSPKANHPNQLRRSWPLSPAARDLPTLLPVRGERPR